jgi:hypothetical protein
MNDEDTPTKKPILEPTIIDENGREVPISVLRSRYIMETLPIGLPE